MRSFILALTSVLALAPPAKAAVDNCLVGTWWVDISDVADLMTMQMGGTATALGGDARMVIAANGAMQIAVRGLEVRIAMPDMPSTDVTINGSASGSIDASGGVYLADVPQYAMSGTADVLGQPLTIPYTSASGMFGGGAGAYYCTASNLVFETDPTTPPRMARTWRRG